jgi:hypothetical protein
MSEAAKVLGALCGPIQNLGGLANKPSGKQKL